MTKLVKGFQNIDSNLVKLHLEVIYQLNQIAQNYGFNPILVPTVEERKFFQKPIGFTSDISQKEFFHCYGGDFGCSDQSWVLRPELTTGVVNYLLRNKKLNSITPLSLFTYGNCFRYENPQHGRYREFWQWNFEQFYFSPDFLGSVLTLLNTIFCYFQITDQIVVEINYLSNKQLSKIKKKVLEKQNDFSFCLLCQNRFQTMNVYGILDCKNCGKFFTSLVNLENFLTPIEKTQYQVYYQQFQKFLPQVKVVKKNFLTRGLDYYSGLVFEIKIPDYPWSQNTILAGGTYPLTAFNSSFATDNWGFGFAIGINRFLEFLLQVNNQYVQKLLSKSFSTIVVGYLFSEQIDDALLLQQILVNNQLKTHLINKKTSFFELLNWTVKHKNHWLVVLGNEYKDEQKVIVRKITTANSKEYFQQCLPMSQVATVIKNNE